MRTKARMFLGAFIVSFVVFMFLIMVLLVDFRSKSTSGYMDDQTVFATEGTDDGGKRIVLFNTEIEVPDFLEFLFK